MSIMAMLLEPQILLDISHAHFPPRLALLQIPPYMMLVTLRPPPPCLMSILI